MAKKWEIEGLDVHKNFCDSAKVILTQRVNYLLSEIDNFFKDETVENLHKIRIALRRVRYNMELFKDCFDKKKFLIFYKQVEFLQDMSGNIRDLDVLNQNIVALKDEKINVTKALLKKLGEKKENLRENFKLELMKFIHSKALSNFQKLLS
jgi:exopolyphosphatase / guanosine-5'-triphosphate,3'-diphosphate pyrophosphatase